MLNTGDKLFISPHYTHARAHTRMHAHTVILLMLPVFMHSERVKREQLKYYYNSATKKYINFIYPLLYIYFFVVVYTVLCFFFSSSRCSAYQQVHGIQLLNSSLFSAFLFILSYNSTISSSSIPFHGYTCGTPLVSIGWGIFAPSPHLRGARD